MAGLTRMAYAEHRKLQIRQSDMVIISATPIPGNEKFISRVINQLYRLGAQVVYSTLAEVHVSGHACKEELKLMHALVRPKYFIPVHGEYRMLWQHAVLAATMGTENRNIVIPELGQVIEMNMNELALGEQVPTGGILVDGLGVGDVGNVVLRDRKHLSQEGLLAVAVVIDRDQEKLVSGPDIVSRGFIFVRENEDLIDNVLELVREILSSNSLAGDNWPDLKNLIKDEVHNYIFEKIKRRGGGRHGVFGGVPPGGRNPRQRGIPDVSRAEGKRHAGRNPGGADPGIPADADGDPDEGHVRADPGRGGYAALFRAERPAVQQAGGESVPAGGDAAAAGAGGYFQNRDRRGGAGDPAAGVREKI